MKPQRSWILYLSILLIYLHTNMPAHAAPVCRERSAQQVILSGNGQRLFVAIEDGECSEVVSLDYASGRVAWRVPGVRSVSAMTLSRDGRRLAISYAGEGSGQKHPLIVLDAETGKLISAASDDPGNGLLLTGKDAFALALRPDGGDLYVIVRIGLVGWNGSTGKPILSQDDPDGGGRLPTDSLDISPDGHWLAGAGKDVAYLLKLPPEGTGTGTTSVPIASRVRAPKATEVRFSPDGSRVAIASGDGTLLWQPETHRAPAVIPGCGKDIAWGADGRSFACQTANGVALLSVESLPGKNRVLASRVGLPAPALLETGKGILLYSASQPVEGEGVPVLSFGSFGGGAPHSIALPARVYPAK